MRQMYSSLHDILEDTIGGNLDIIGKSDIEIHIIQYFLYFSWDF